MHLQAQEHPQGCCCAYLNVAYNLAPILAVNTGCSKPRLQLLHWKPIQTNVTSRLCAADTCMCAKGACVQTVHWSQLVAIMAYRVCQACALAIRDSTPAEQALHTKLPS
jgi:hypothetical protein